MQEKKSHIYIYGELTDFLTGKILPDTDDERIRQSLARLLLEERGFRRHELISGEKIITTFAGQSVTSDIDIVVQLQNLPLLLLRCAPGSLVSRERAAIAAARIYHPHYQLPLAVVYNGRDAELLDCYTGKTLATGIEAIPHREQLQQQLTAIRRPPQADDARQREKRILNAFDKKQCCIVQHQRS